MKELCEGKISLAVVFIIVIIIAPSLILLFYFTAGSSDYTGLPATLTFGSQDNLECVEVTIVNDEEPEACERFMYQFSAQGGRVSLPSGSVLINDDDREFQ